MEQTRPIWKKKLMLFGRGLITSDELCHNLIDYPFGCPMVDEQPDPEEFSQELKEMLKSYLKSRLPYTVREFSALSAEQDEKYIQATRRWIERLAKSLEIDVRWNQDRQCFESN